MVEVLREVMMRGIGMQEVEAAEDTVALLLPETMVHATDRHWHCHKCGGNTFICVLLLSSSTVTK